ncbi:MAG: hypothetical protein L0177_00530 [Chloroflexi bacterium]|nr:hypothetical protein [Chloroflexota bacterium]
MSLPKHGLTTILPLLLAALACTQNTPDIASPLNDGWTEVKVQSERLPALPGFTMKLPPGWCANHRPGDQAYLGTIHGDGALLYFHYYAGARGTPLSQLPESEYSVTFETLDGVSIRLARPRDDLNGRTEAALTNLHGDSSPIGLVISGNDLTEEHREHLIAIARSVRSLDAEGRSPIASASAPLAGFLCDSQGRIISYQDALAVLVESIRHLALEYRADFGTSERCVALDPYWVRLRKERIPESLFNALLAELQSFPMPVYEAVDYIDADSKCERDFAQRFHILPLELFELGQGRISVSIGERIGYGGSSWVITFERREGDWVMISGRITGMS